MLTVWFTIVAVLVGGPVSAANYRQVGLFLHPSHYLVPQYTTSAGPHAEFVFVAGEPILLLVEFSNWGGKSVRLNTKGLPPDALATFELRRMEGDGWQSIPFRLSLAGKPRVTMPGQTVSGPWGNTVELDDDSLEIPLEIVSTANAVPGIYRLVVKDIAVTCEPDCEVTNRAGLFGFEVRDGSELSARVELLTRRAWNALMYDSNLKDADVSIAQLLNIYPQSVWGHQLRGQLAEARKQRDVAAREYELAVEILRRGEDKLYIQARPAEVEDRIRGLQSMREALKAKSRN
jgi:hypothetical protein